MKCKLPLHQAILDLYKNYNINLDINNRWESGIEHHSQTYNLMEHLKSLDFEINNDYFCFKTGGDGDNGEQLMYLLDMFFEMKDCLKKDLKG